MRYLTLLAFLFLVFICCEPQKKEVAKIKVDTGQQKKALKTTLNDMWDAIEKGDIERYASYVHPDYTQFGETDAVLKVGKEAEVNGVADWIKNSTGIHTEMEDPRITINGDVAWIVYYWRDSGITNQKAFASRGKSTRIFVKEGDKWLCIHGHYTLLPEDEKLN